MRIDATGDAIELYYAQGWTDDLPVVPPNASRRPDARVVAVQHPLAALAPETVLRRADAVVDQIIAQLMAAP